MALLVLCGLLFIPTVIIAVAAGNDTNLTTIIAESLRLATPLAIGDAIFTNQPIFFLMFVMLAFTQDTLTG